LPKAKALNSVANTIVGSGGEVFQRSVAGGDPATCLREKSKHVETFLP
jgi:hypothetical protein